MSLARLQNENKKKDSVYYEVDTSKLLGKGGMGQVFQGKQIDPKTGIRRDAAVKFLFSDLPDHAIERARREAGIHIDDERLLQMYDFIELTDSSDNQSVKKRYHVASEFIDGVRLIDLVHGKTTNQFREKLEEVENLYKLYKEDRLQFSVKIISEILEGVKALHNEGYIHRDLNPNNIMVSAGGHVKIIDYGIAKKIKEMVNQKGVQDHQLTSQGVFVGTPSYAAPELVLGNTAFQNETTDIYAIGVILFQLTTGRLPFEGNAAMIIKQQVHSPLPLNLVPYPALRRIIKKATSKNQKQRYQSATDMLEDIVKKSSMKWTFIFWEKWWYILLIGICLAIGFFLGPLLLNLFN